MPEVIWDAPAGALDIPAHGIRCEAGVPVTVPDELAAELLERADFKKATRPQTAKGKE